MRFIVHNPAMESFVRNAEEVLKTKYALSSREIAHMWSTDEPISRKRIAPEIMDMLNSTVCLLVHQTGLKNRLHVHGGFSWTLVSVESRGVIWFIAFYRLDDHVLSQNQLIVTTISSSCHIVHIILSWNHFVLVDHLLQGVVVVFLSISTQTFSHGLLRGLVTQQFVQGAADEIQRILGHLGGCFFVKVYTDLLDELIIAGRLGDELVALVEPLIELSTLLLIRTPSEAHDRLLHDQTTNPVYLRPTLLP